MKSIIKGDVKREMLQTSNFDHVVFLSNVYASCFFTYYESY